MVHLNVAKKEKAKRVPEEMRRFFDRFRRGPEQEDQGQYDEYNVPPQRGNGSGWVYDKKGHIVTNYHVVRNAQSIEVRFHDKSTAKAKVVAKDKQTDIAILKVDKANLHPADLADKPVKQGDIVFAFGSPFGSQFQFSVSQGIVSGLGRRLGILGQGGYENFIQTDAAINPGNSGGPLTNIYGEVVGMNTAIATRTRSFGGLGFAIPAKMLQKVVDELLKEGTVRRGYLGVMIGNLTEEMAKSFSYDGKGVLVQDVLQDTPAAKADLKAGDIIVSVEGQKTPSTSDLRRNIAAYPPGKKVKVTVYRQDEGKKTLQVKLAEQPENMAAAPSGGTPQPSPEKPEGLTDLRKLGIKSVVTLTQQRAKELGLESVEGVLVKDVRPKSVAAAKGLRPGAIILRVEGTRVTTVKELTKELGKHDLTKGVRLRVQTRQGLQTFVVLTLPKE